MLFLQGTIFIVVSLFGKVKIVEKMIKILDCCLINNSNPPFLPRQECAHAHIETRFRCDHFRFGEVDTSVTGVRHRVADSDSGRRRTGNWNDRVRRS